MNLEAYLDRVAAGLYVFATYDRLRESAKARWRGSARRLLLRQWNRNCEEAPLDDAVQIATEGEWVGEASRFEDEDLGGYFWQWANGSRVVQTVLAWQPLSPHPSLLES